MGITPLRYNSFLFCLGDIRNKHLAKIAGTEDCAGYVILCFSYCFLHFVRQRMPSSVLFTAVKLCYKIQTTFYRCFPIVINLHLLEP